VGEQDERVGSRDWVVPLALLLCVLAAVLAVEIFRALAPGPPTPVIRPDGLPPNPTAERSARFTFTDGKPVTFECALDRSAFVTCGTGSLGTTSYRGPLSARTHLFRVRARSGSRTSSAATYSWVVLALPVRGSIALGRGMPVEISGHVRGLVPGVTEAIPVTFRNPGAVRIRVTRLTVTVSPDSAPAGCPSAANPVLGQATGITPSAPVTVPARGSVTVGRYPRAPRIMFRNLAKSQNTCKGKTFHLTFSAQAHA
jgi:hypothetical protein